MLLVIGAGGSTAAPGAKTKSINRQIDLPPEALDAPLLPVPGLLRRRSAARQTPIAAKSSPGSCEIPMLPQQPDRLPFGPGERLDFDVRMFGMKTGGISLSMSGREKVDDKMTYARVGHFVVYFLPTAHGKADAACLHSKHTHIKVQTLSRTKRQTVGLLRQHRNLTTAWTAFGCDGRLTRCGTTPQESWYGQ